MGIDAIRIDITFDSFRLKMERIARPKVKSHVFMSVRIVPECPLISNIAYQLFNIVAATDFSILYNFYGNL